MFSLVETAPPARSPVPLVGGPAIRRCIVLACLLSALLPAAAHASSTQELVFDARRDLMDASTRTEALDRLDRMGVTRLRLLMYWKEVAPQADSAARPAVDLRDPANYSWGAYDDVVRAATERGMKVLPTLSAPGPKWAMRDRKDFVTYPSPELFGRFVEAVGRRYAAQVDTWAIGNEPNHPDFLRPQYKGGEARSPGVYRALYQAATKALDRSGNAGDTKLLGEMLPRGKRGTSVAPLAFLRGVLCLDRSFRKVKGRTCGRLDVDGVSHHPYTIATGPFFESPNKDDVTIGTLSRLTSALDRAARAGVVRKGMPIWLTEFGIQSTPDRISGVSTQRQVEYRAMAERMAWDNRRIRAFSQYLLTDDNPIDGVVASKRYGGFESGLRYATGHDKPSLTAFPLTLSAERTRKGVTLWGLVRPAQGVTTAEVLYKDPGTGGAYQVLKQVRTNARGYFTLRTSARSGRRYNLRWQGAEGYPVRPIKRPR